MTNYYETDELLNQYLAFHYGVDYFDVPNYPVRCAQLCMEFMGNRPRRKALDLGCAVGRSTFELALGFDAAVGVDLSARFIDAAQALQKGNALNYFLHDEGDLGRTMQLSLADFNYSECSLRVEFSQGDACRLGAEHTGYDLIFAGNLIDRVNNPTEFLNDTKPPRTTRRWTTSGTRLNWPTRTAGKKGFSQTNPTPCATLTTPSTR